MNRIHSTHSDRIRHLPGLLTVALAALLVLVSGEALAQAPFDTDGDGVLHLEDNCPCTHNPEQEDSNEDGVGNACDPDLDGDKVVGGPDIIRVLRARNQYDPDADCNSNGIVDHLDVTQVFNAFGQPVYPPPAPEVGDTVPYSAFVQMLFGTGNPWADNDCDGVVSGADLIAATQAES